MHRKRILKLPCIASEGGSSLGGDGNAPFPVVPDLRAGEVGAAKSPPFFIRDM